MPMRQTVHILYVACFVEFRRRAGIDGQSQYSISLHIIAYIFHLPLATAHLPLQSG